MVIRRSDMDEMQCWDAMMRRSDETDEVVIW